MATDYDKLRADMIENYNNPNIEVDPTINAVQRKFASAYADLMVATMKAMTEDQVHPVPLTITLVMASVGPLVNMLANMQDAAAREEMRKLAIEQFTASLLPDAKLIGELRDVPEKAN